MSKEPVQRYIIKRVDGFVSVCDTQDNEAPIDNSANGLEALLNAINTANSRLKADLEKSDGVVFTQAVENERLKAEVERWEFIHRLDSLAIKKQKDEIERLKEGKQS